MAAELAINLKRLSPRNPADVSELQATLDGAPTYWLRVSGKRPSGFDADATFRALPQGRTVDDKFVFSVYFGAQPVGCIDLVLGYPDVQTAMLGLLLLDEAHQNKGLGKPVFHAVEEFLRSYPRIRYLRIAVVGTNEQVIPFWKTLGFRENGVRRPYRSGNVVSEAIVLEKYLD